MCSVVTQSTRSHPGRCDVTVWPLPCSSTRPTTRFVQAIAQLSSKQLVIGIGAPGGGDGIGILLLGPWLRTNFPFLWYEIPAFLIVGPIAYARRGE